MDYGIGKGVSYNKKFTINWEKQGETLGKTAYVNVNGELL